MTVACYVIDAVLNAMTQLHIGTGLKTGAIKRSRIYVPGSVLRGALGIVLLKANSKVYADLLGDESNKASKLFFRHAFPAHLGCGGVYYPAPRTIYTCQNRQCKKVYERMVPPFRCEVCDGSVKPFVGYLCDGCGDLEENPVALSRFTSTALNRDTGSAAQVEVDLKAESMPKETEVEEMTKGMLHTLELIPKGSAFALRMLVHRGEKEALDVLKSALVKGLPDEGIGGGKSRGSGKVGIDKLRVREVTTDELAERAKEIDTRHFLVRLLSPMVLDGRLLEAKTLLENARRAYTWMFHEGKPELPMVEEGKRRFSFETYSVWSLKDEGVRRAVAISPGSVFEYKSVEQDESLALALAALEFCSVGSYKPNGCGQVIIEKAR